MSEKFLELQPSLVQRFMKKFFKDDQYVLSSNLKSKFSRTMTIFLHYIMTIASQISHDKHRATVTIEDVKKALDETGWDEDFIAAIESRVLEMDSKTSKSNRQIQKESLQENIESNENANENENDDNGQIEEEIKSDNEIIDVENEIVD